MNRMMPTCAFAAACVFAVSVSAQDTTVKSKTKIEADDASVVTMTGCLQAGSTADTFVLTNATMVKGDEITSKSKTKTDVDEDETEVKTQTRTEVERGEDEKAVGTAGAATTYELMPKAGVNLTPHVGHKVEITAVALEPKDGDDDAKVDIETETKVNVEDAPDSKVKSETEAELPRGKHARMTAVSIKHIAASCQM